MGQILLSHPARIYLKTCPDLSGPQYPLIVATLHLADDSLCRNIDAKDPESQQPRVLERLPTIRLRHFVPAGTDIS